MNLGWLAQLVQSVCFTHKGSGVRIPYCPQKVSINGDLFLFMATVYILYSENLDRYYVGSTNSSVEERLAKHLTNHSGFTGKAKDWIVVHTEVFEEKTDALKRELAIKNKKSRKYIENLLSKPD